MIDNFYSQSLDFSNPTKIYEGGSSVIEENKGESVENNSKEVSKFEGTRSY